MLKSIFRRNNTQSRLASSSRTRKNARALFQLHSTDAHRHATHREGQITRAHQVTPLAIQARGEKLQDTDIFTAEK